MNKGRGISLLLAMTVLGACSPSGGQDAGPAPTRPATTVGSAVSTVPAVPVAEAPPTTGAVTPAPTTTTAVAAARWSTCTDPRRGFSISHPPGWHTAYGCQYLDPEPLDIPLYTDGFFSALMVLDGEDLFERALSRFDSGADVIVLREQTTVDGRRAIRYETESTGEAYFDKGTRRYSVVLDRSGRTFEVITMWFPGTSVSEYELRKRTVDQAVETVVFR